MGYIDNLLRGRKVEWKALGEVAKYEQPSKYLVHSTKYSDSFPTPVLTAGKSFILGYTDEYTGIYRASEAPIILFDDFTTASRWVDFDFKVKSSATKIITSRDESVVLLKYIYYWLNTLPSECVEGDHKRRWISTYTIKKIPVPPLDVQEEIVRILDRFTALEAELEAELEARQKQYEYYRDRLLSAEGIRTMYGEAVKPIALGDLGQLVRGSGLQRKDLTASGVPAIHYGQIYTYYGAYTTHTIAFVSPETARSLKKVNYGDVIITNTSENVEDVNKAVAYLVQEEGVTGGHATIFKPAKGMLGQYLAYYTQTQEFFNLKRRYARGTKVIDVSASDLAKITIPLPSLHVQERIVRILDKFTALTTSLTAGLPGEIALRRRQYEYYREQLLTFE